MTSFEVPTLQISSQIDPTTIETISRLWDLGPFWTHHDSSPGFDVYDHTTLKPPDPVRSPKLSNVGPWQYWGGWPLGNPGCCTLFLFWTRGFCYPQRILPAKFKYGRCVRLKRPCPGGNNQADEVQTDCWLIASWKLKPIAHHFTGSSQSRGNLWCRLTTGTIIEKRRGVWDMILRFCCH